MRNHSPYRFCRLSAEGGRRMPSCRDKSGEGGIRTLGTLLEYGALAKRCFRPLSHLTLLRTVTITNPAPFGVNGKTILRAYRAT